MALPESCRLEQTWRVWNVSDEIVIWVTILISDLGHNWMDLGRGAVEGCSGETFLPCQRPYVAKSLFRKGLRCAGGVPFRPAGPDAGTFQSTAGSAARDGFGQKTSRQGYLRQRSMCSPAACVPHVPSAAATDTCAAAPPLTGECPSEMVGRKTRESG